MRTTRSTVLMAALGAGALVAPLAPLVEVAAVQAPAAEAPGDDGDDRSPGCDVDDLGEQVAASPVVRHARSAWVRSGRRVAAAIRAENAALRSLRRAGTETRAQRLRAVRATHTHTLAMRRARARAAARLAAAVAAERARLAAACLPGVPAPVPAPTPPPPPTPSGSAPTGLVADSATALATGAFRLRWTAVLGATSYQVLRNGVVLGTTTVPSFRPAAVALNARASYTVVALTGGSVSPPSAAVSAGMFRGDAVPDRFGRFVYGDVVVSLAVTGSRATGCWASYPTASSSGVINTRAIPVLCQEALTAQSAAIAAVTGASALSAAFVGSLQSALTRAKI